MYSDIDNIKVDELFRQLKTYHPSVEGSDNEKKIVVILKKYIEKIGLPVVETTLINDTVHSFSSNLKVEIPGNTNNTIIFAVSLSSKIQDNSYFDNSLNIILNLLLMEYVKTLKLSNSFVFLFLGGQGTPGRDKNIGSDFFLNSYEQIDNSIVLYLDFVDFSKPLLLSGNSEKLFVPKALLKSIVDILSSKKYIFNIDSYTLFKTRLFNFKNSSLVSEFLMNNIPAIIFTHKLTGLKKQFMINKSSEITDSLTDQGVLKRQYLNLERIEKVFKAIILKFEQNYPLEFDNHYLYFQLFNEHIFFSELQIVYITLFILFIRYIMWMLGIHTYKFSFHILKKSLPFLLVFFLYIFTTFLFSYLCNFPLRYLTGNKFPFLKNPFLYFCLSCSLIPMLTLFIYHKIKKPPFMLKHYYYSSTAITLITVYYILSFTFNFSTLYIFIWVLLFAWFSSFAGNVLWKFFCYLFTPFSILFTLAYFMILKDEQVLSLIYIDMPFLSVLFFSFLFYPFLLFVIRWLIHLRSRYLINGLPLMTGSFIFAIFLLLFCIYMFSPAYKANYLQNIFVTCFCNMNQDVRKLEFTSNDFLRNIEINSPLIPVNEFDVRKDSFSWQIAFYEKWYEYEQIQDIYLYNQTIMFKLINLQGNIKRVHYILKGEKDFSIYNLSFPYKKVANNIYEIIIGFHPPSELELIMELPLDNQYTLDMEITYNHLPKNFFDIRGKNKRFIPQTVFLESVTL